ncbi:DUF5131 family protein [Streptomyces sp. XY533]|uniref:DUF5131 family protein n=1 Tax=Streptomyces sp. XY533 TaxID=1519481 RepID=UPI0006AFE697|nr:phage Gp37/Gp68 family protein [Streptomyces sp. XY533]KOU99117.1 phage protein Gp37/Gp68 [Streptomyces sp. XY533]
MTSIEWTDETWNPTTGCDRISPGCDNCYALTMAKRLKAMGADRYQQDGDPRTSGPGFALTTHPDALTVPNRWREPRMVFVNSMSDLFHARVPVDFIADVWRTMHATPRHTYQILTKRPERLARVLDQVHTDLSLTAPLPNVWLGTSIENGDYARRAEALRQAPAAVRFISAEPLLGPLPSLELDGIHWLIVGGESGPGARPLDTAWVEDVITQCRAAGTAPFVKQLGTVWAREHQAADRKGGKPQDWPTALRVREYPQQAPAAV